MEVPRPGLSSATHPLCSTEGPGQAGEPLDECRASAGATVKRSTGATVKDQPEPESKMSRNSVNHEWCASGPIAPSVIR
jgi:hypothetical protein